MNVKDGYRLLRASDVGKVIGVDIEPIFDVDTDANPYANWTSGNLLIGNETNTIIQMENYSIILYYKESTSSTSLWLNGGWNQFLKDVLQYPQVDYSGYTITSIGGDPSQWNNWLYVKDIAPKKGNLKQNGEIIYPITSTDAIVGFREDVRSTIAEDIKFYSTPGDNEDGAMTQKAVTEYVSSTIGDIDTLLTEINTGEGI